jgi:hypothetical protein
MYSMNDVAQQPVVGQALLILRPILLQFIFENNMRTADALFTLLFSLMCVDSAGFEALCVHTLCPKSAAALH